MARIIAILKQVILHFSDEGVGLKPYIIKISFPQFLNSLEKNYLSNK
jgi:hypothetical protein